MKTVTLTKEQFNNILKMSDEIITEILKASNHLLAWILGFRGNLRQIAENLVHLKQEFIKQGEKNNYTYTAGYLKSYADAFQGARQDVANVFKFEIPFWAKEAWEKITNILKRLIGFIGNIINETMKLAEIAVKTPRKVMTWAPIVVGGIIILLGVGAYKALSKSEIKITEGLFKRALTKRHG